MKQKLISYQADKIIDFSKIVEVTASPKTYFHQMAVVAVMSIFKTAGLNFGNDLTIKFQMVSFKGKPYGKDCIFSAMSLLSNADKLSAYHYGPAESIMLKLSSPIIPIDVVQFLAEHLATNISDLKIDNDNLYHCVESGMLKIITRRNKELFEKLASKNFDITLYQIKPDLLSWMSVGDR
ncbi:MAG: hypothetical protein PHF25_08830 [Candidatus Margulisbacteria bacterium]|nr:hypothetical protein [Candidatus Margulisiibacteriota bacterium]